MDDITNARVSNDENVKPDQSLRQRRVGDLNLAAPKTDHNDAKSSVTSSATGIDALHARILDGGEVNYDSLVALAHDMQDRSTKENKTDAKSSKKDLVNQRLAPEDRVRIPEYIKKLAGQTHKEGPGSKEFTKDPWKFGNVGIQTHNPFAADKATNTFSPVPASSSTTSDGTESISDSDANISDLDLTSSNAAAAKNTDNSDLVPLSKEETKAKFKQQRIRARLATLAGARRARQVHIENLNTLITGMVLMLLSATGITTFCLSGDLDPFRVVVGLLLALLSMVMMILVNGVKGWLME